jgi:hypothetical protein
MLLCPSYSPPAGLQVACACLGCSLGGLAVVVEVPGASMLCHDIVRYICHDTGCRGASLGGLGGWCTLFLVLLLTMCRVAECLVGRCTGGTGHQPCAQCTCATPCTGGAKVAGGLCQWLVGRGCLLLWGFDQVASSHLLVGVVLCCGPVAAGRMQWPFAARTPWEILSQSKRRCERSVDGGCALTILLEEERSL